MKEKEAELKVFRVKMFCDCGGEMEPKGFVLFSDPIEYRHECNKCGLYQTFKEQYPTIKYRAVESE